jgi:hypothetical protein
MHDQRSRSECIFDWTWRKTVAICRTQKLQGTLQQTRPCRRTKDSRVRTAGDSVIFLCTYRATNNWLRFGLLEEDFDQLKRGRNDTPRGRCGERIFFSEGSGRRRAMVSGLLRRLAYRQGEAASSRVYVTLSPQAGRKRKVPKRCPQDPKSMQELRHMEKQKRINCHGPE